MLDFTTEAIRNISTAVLSFHQLVGKNNISSSKSTEKTNSETSSDHSVDLDVDGLHPITYKLFFKAQSV